MSYVHREVHSIHIPEWPIAHGFFGIAGGVSKDEFSGLNGGGNHDKIENIEYNRMLALKSLHIECSGWIPKQEHTSRVLELSKDAKNMHIPADALVTREKGIPLGILTADCAPVLFYDPIAQVIGSAHAGWRGATYGILENTVHAMMDLGCNTSSLEAAIGPTIHRQSYGVSSEFIQTIQKETPWDIGPMISHSDDFWYFDLPMYIHRRLQNWVHRIYDVKVNTFGQDFFSRRYALYKQDPVFYGKKSPQGNPPILEKDYGRNMSWITLS